ncbi:MAG: hypothetical protein ABWZ57_09200 [Mesorhizobium sp.]
MRAGIDSRNLAPPIAATADDPGIIEQDVDGSPAPAQPLAATSEAPAQADPELPESSAADDDANDAGSGDAALGTPIAPGSGDSLSSDDGDGPQGLAAPVTITVNLPSSGPLGVSEGGPVARVGDDGGGSARTDGPEDGAQAHGTAPAAGAASTTDAESEGDGGHDVTVTQIAEVHQDASVLVTGYVGDVVARLTIDQDLVMLQDVAISFTLDGDGHFKAHIAQDTFIDQSLDIDVKIWDVDGVLYLDIAITDKILVEQDATLDLAVTDGEPGGDVVIDQDLTMDQDVDIDIDIEDDLAERYLVTVDVDVIQAVDAEQDVVLGIRDVNGAIEMDVDSLQTAMIDQSTVVHADFVAV